MKKWYLSGFILVQWIGFVYGQSLSTSQKKYLEKHLVTISKDTSLNEANWKQLGSQLKNKNLVLLGENNHGSKEIFRWRNDLIQYLHRELGFNTVLFESGFGELLPMDRKEFPMCPLQMTRGLFGGWRTPEFLELMACIKSEKMAYAGIDVQRSGGSFRNVLDVFCKNHQIDSTHYHDLEVRYSLVHGQLNNRKSVYDSLQSSTQELIMDYQRLSNRIDELEDQVSSHQVLLVNQTLKNRMAYLNYMSSFKKDQDWHRRWARRDSMMAENLIWLRDHIYPDQKIIVIAHNFHISKWNELEATMGEILNARYPQQTYVLGLFSGQGAYADNSGNPVSMTPPDSTRLDIKHLIGAMNAYAGFIDLKVRSAEGNQWFREPMVINDSFIDLKGTNQLILQKHFDGLLLIQKVSPAYHLE
jgi:erythromycin esterase